MINAKIGNELLNKLKEFEKADLKLEIPVIVTIKPRTDPKVLERNGMKIDRTFKSISAISGTIPSDRIYEIAQLDQVEIIEYDGTVSAL